MTDMTRRALLAGAGAAGFGLPGRVPRPGAVRHCVTPGHTGRPWFRRTR